VLNVIKTFRKIIKEHTVELFEREGNRRRLKARLLFVDGSVLYIKEYYFGRQRKYTYHWTNAAGELIIRWDNAPHWPDVETFPHHKHVGSPVNVQPSLETDLADVLTVIKSKIAVT
jgi:hypothetical protein